MDKILVTDSLFIYDEHEQLLKDAGYEVHRLDKPDASEEELCEAVKDKVGYILGGIERVTEKVIDSADKLKAISLLGVGYEFFIPAWEYATKKGISISNTPYGPTQEVAEWAITAALLMNRQFLELGLAGELNFAVTKGIESQRVGIIGLGRVGTRITEMLSVFKPSSISYYGRHRQIDKEDSLGVNYLELSELLEQSDIVFVCVPDEASNLISATELKAMKTNALLVNITHPGVIHEDDLLEALKQKHIRAISDHPMSSPEFGQLPYSSWYSMKTSNTITEAGSKLMSDMAAQSLLNLLSEGKDEYKVN